jgi:hypothetical protein
MVRLMPGRRFAGTYGVAKLEPGLRAPSMNRPIVFLDQLDQLCQQIATAIQHSELQIYAILAVIVLAAFFAFPPKDDPDQI